MKHYVFKDGRWMLLDRVFRIAASLMIGAWLARYLGPKAFGELAYVLAYIAIFQSIASLGLDGIVVRDIAKSGQFAAKILGTAFLLRFSAGVLVWILAIIGLMIEYGLGSSTVMLGAIIGGCLIFQSSDVFDLWFQSQHRNRNAIAARAPAFLVSNFAKVTLILCQAPLIAFALVISAEAFLGGIGLYFFYRRHPCSGLWSSSMLMARKLLTESWPFLLSAISVTFYMRVDQIMIKSILGSHDLGIFAAIQPIASAWQFIPAALVAILGPLAAKRKVESEEEYWIFLKKIFQVFSLIGWIICIPISVASGLIVKVLFGTDYSAGSGVLSIYIFSFFFLNLGVAQSLWVINESRSKFWLFKTFIGMSISLIGNLYFLPRYGLMGAAIIGVLSQLFAAIISNIWFAPKVLDMQIKSIFTCWIDLPKLIITRGSIWKQS